MVMSDSEGRAALAEVVGAELVPRSELDDRLTAAGHRVTDEQLRRIIQFDTRFYEVGDDVGFLPGLTDGVAFSVWVDPATADEDFLVVKPALEVLIWWIVQGQVDLFDEAGDRLGEVETDGWMIDGVDTDVLLGPDGWLDPYADSWVAFRVREGTLVIERLTGPPPVDAARAAAVRSAFQAVAKHQEFRRFGDDEAIDVPRSGVQEVLKQAIGCDNSLFVGEPLPPMSELFGAAGLRIERPWVVPADLDADLYAEAEAMRLAMARWGADAGEVRKINVLLGAIELHREGNPISSGETPEEREKAPTLFEALVQRPSVTRVLGYEFSDAELCEAVLGFAQSVSEVFEGDPGAWGMRWLAAHCHLVLGEVDAAAAILDELPSEVDRLPVLLDRARVAVERSQAKEALRLLALAAQQVDDLPEVSLMTFEFRRWITRLHEEVEVWATHRPPPMARRNERCPCGSGRKYKVCHLGRELHPVEDRSLWLHHKMVRFAQEQEAEGIESLVWVLTDAIDAPDRWSEMSKAPLIPDIVLHEGQLEQRFLDGRQATLPDDEVLLAQQWQLVDRSVFEVESKGPDVVVVRDLATGELKEVVNVFDSPITRPGSILVGRPLPVGDVYRAFSGFMGLRPDLVQHALAALDDKDPDALLGLLGSLQRPPIIKNTDGHDMEPTEIIWSLPDGVDVTDALFRAGLDDDGGSWTLARDTTSRSNALIASLQVGDDTIIASVNSAERAEELIELFGEHVPDAHHVSTKVISPDEFDENDPPELPNQAEMLANPEMRAALETYMANYESEWLDSSIPALGGRTPREAAADPIAREELKRLLATMPELEGGVGMSAERLLVALGLQTD